MLVSTILSAVQFGFTSFLREYNLGETIQKHSTAALELLNVREKYLSLITDLKAGLLTSETIIERRDSLQEELSHIYKGSPRTFSKAYKKAQNVGSPTLELPWSRIFNKLKFTSATTAMGVHCG